MAPEDSLDSALDDLYSVPPGEFVVRRKALASELRTAGHTGPAKELAEARRPTTAAWALNQLARQHPELVDALIEQSVEVRAIQSRATAGAADELRRASAARRAALNDATDAAVTSAGEIATNPEAHRDAIAATLESASVDETLATALREGRLVREAGGPVGFPEIATLRVVGGGKGTGRKSRSEPSPAPVDEQAQAELDHAESEARKAKRAASEAALVAESADERVEAARTAVDEAKAALAEAQAEARTARAELKAREKAAAAADKAVEAAHRRLA